MHRFLIKYRPRQFSEYIDFERFRPVIKRIIEDRLWHGVLVTGEHGMGKSTLVRILVNRLVCELPHDLEPCLTCRSCLQMVPGEEFAGFEENIKSGSTITKSWTGMLHYDLMALSLFFFPRHVWIEDLDKAPTSVVESLSLPFDMAYTTPMFFTATHLEKLPPEFVQRVKVVKIRKLSPEGLISFVLKICTLEGIAIKEAEAVAELIRLANRNYRNILNILESVSDYGDPLSLLSLSSDHVLDNVGLQVGDKRFIAAPKGAGSKGAGSKGAGSK